MSMLALRKAGLRAASIACALGYAASALADVTFADTSPNSSDLDNADPDGASGGRVNGLASVAGDNDTFYAATEWGGIYTSTDGGVSWSILSGHRPMVTWDVEVDPGNVARLYATSFFDGRTATQSGINVSTDTGATWTRPASATPPAGYNCAANAIAEPAAFGISVRPDASANVVIGTNCGVALSSDSGVTWTFVDPTPLTIASRIWDAVYHSGGTIDVCGDDGHFRSVDGGVTWTGGAGGLPRGRCSIAVSPDEAYVLLVAASDNNIYESDDAGATWTNLGTPGFSRQGRIPFVETNQRSDDATGNRFDLWFGDVSLYRGLCRTPAMPAMGGATRCPAGVVGAIPTPYALPANWAGSFTRCRDADGNGCAHDDVGVIVFDSEAANDACPTIFSCDGGVYRNTDTGGDCHDPDFEQPSITPHALWLFGMEGVNRAGAEAEDLYFGLQDNGTFGTTNAGAASPTWHNESCCDGFSTSAEATRVLYVLGAFGARSFRLYSAGAGMTGSAEINTYPADGLLTTFNFDESVARFGPQSFVVLTNDCTPPGTAFDGVDNDGDMNTDEADEGNGCSNVNGGDGGVYITTDITASPIVWTELGNATEPPTFSLADVQVSMSGGTPTFYVKAGGGTRRTGGSLWRFDGTNPAGAWTQVDTNDGLAGGFNVFAADPSNPNNLYASNMAPAGPQMVFSTDGGATWDPDPELDALMRGNGAFLMTTALGPTNFTGFQGYPQPSLLAFDPANSNVLIAGGIDSGVFMSWNGGGDWGLVSDPFTSNTSGVPHIPRPYFSYFDNTTGDTGVYVGTQGRGVWRLTVELPTADAGGPYETDEGIDVALDGTGSSDPGGGALDYAWDFDDDGDFDDATGPTPLFDRVGQDGVFTVRLKVSAGGAFDIDEATVTVNNVAPTISLMSDAPVNEGSLVTVTGLVSDPGWLDPLTATIDWDDGMFEDVAGVLENLRPEATLSFSITHLYGDNGLFSVEGCGFDDDTSVCEVIGVPIDNVVPTAEIDESDAVVLNGTPTIVAEAGEPVEFSGRTTDPGSDDLSVTWTWDDGTPNDVELYLVNPPLLDPLPSPSVQPRDVTDTRDHTFADACLYLVQFDVTDDDGGVSPGDEVSVVIVGNAEDTRSAGYWRHQYRGRGQIHFDAATLECYLAITRHVSAVFDEVVPLTTFAQAEAVLNEAGNGGSQIRHLDRQLLAAWLNFANGGVGLFEMVDIDGDSVPDATFVDVIVEAEAVRLDPTSTNAELEAQKDALETINVRAG